MNPRDARPEDTGSVDAGPDQASPETWPDVDGAPGEAGAAEQEESAAADAPAPDAAAAPAPGKASDEPSRDDGNGRVEHAAGDFAVPGGYGVLEGSARGARRSVGIVVSRFNGSVTTKLLEGALAELDEAGVARDAITIMPVPGAFELPLAAMALAKTRRYACIVALGCVVRGDTPHFDYVAGEAASGLQLAALETGVPVAFGVLTLEEAEQAQERLDKGAEAARTGLEMADVFAQLRAAAAR